MKVILYVVAGCQWCKKMESFIMTSDTITEFDVVVIDSVNKDTFVPTLLENTGLREPAYPMTLIKKEAGTTQYKKYIIGYSPEEYIKAIKEMENKI